MIQEFWNKAVIRPERPLVPRDYCYASELGGSLIDRYLKMKGIPYTNMPNPRAKRKMMAGVFTESIICYVFYRAGILKQVQRRFESDWTPLSVHGKSDLVVGGKPDIDQARKALQQFEYFPEMHEISMNIIENLESRVYPDRLYEVKSIATYKADYFEKMGDNAKPVKGHEFQAKFYSVESNLPTILSYICRDDLRMTEFHINGDENAKKEIYTDVLSLKEYIDADERPPLQPLILLEDGKFSKNLEVEYSNYLTMLYGFEEPRDYSESVKKQIASWNRVIARYKNGDKITDKNKVVREEIESNGYNFEEILQSFVEITEPEEE